MPKYIVRRDTYISHEGRTARAGDEVTINWPPGCEPKQLSDNLELLEEAKPAPKGKKEAGGDLT